MPRYVLADEFWEIEREDAVLVIRSGPIGTAGKEQQRRYKTSGHAEIQYDVMIRQKVDAGFELSTATAVPAGAAIEDPAKLTELEAAIAADPYGTSVHAVYGDWLQSRGDPRGELIALQLAEDAKPGDAKLVAAIGRHIEKHKATLLGPRLVQHAGKLRDFTEGPFVWRFGFIHIVQLDRDTLGGDDKVSDLLDELLAHPSGRFVAEIAIKNDRRADVAAIVDLLARRPPASLRAFEISSDSEFGDLGPLLAANPRLRRLAVRGRTGGKELTPMRETLRSIQQAALSELVELELRLVNRDARLAHLVPILRRDYPALTCLRIRSADGPTELLAELVESPLARQLVTLDLGLCEVGDRALDLLVSHAARFPELREVILTRGEASRTALARLADVVKKLTFFDRDPDDDDRFDDDYYDEVQE